jgi:hypothetical protein
MAKHRISYVITKGSSHPWFSFCSGGRIGALFHVKDLKVENYPLCGNYGIRHSSSLANVHVSAAPMVYEGHSY